MLLLLFDGVFECADAFDSDVDLVVALEREGVRRHNPGPSEQEAAIREAVIAKEVLD